MFLTRLPKSAQAALMILGATAFIAASTTVAKALATGALGPPLHPLQVSHGRFLAAFALFSSAASVMRPRFTPVHWRLHLGRSSFGWGGVSLMFAAVAFIPMADATAISFLNPIFAMALAIPLLGERVGPIRWTAAAIALFGTCILLRPTPASFQPAALLALAAAAAMGIEVIFMKKLTRLEAPFQILLINNAIGLSIATLAVWPVWQMPTAHQWLGLAGVGGFMACAQIGFINGMARAEASFVAPFTYATLVFATLYDFVIFGVFPDWITWTGSAIILSGALALALREARLSRHRPHPR